MTHEQAREKAVEIVFVYYTIGDIERECKSRGIRIVRSRNIMERKLIEAMTKELLEQSRTEEL